MKHLKPKRVIHNFHVIESYLYVNSFVRTRSLKKFPWCFIVLNAKQHLAEQWRKKGHSYKHMIIQQYGKIYFLVSFDSPWILFRVKHIRCHMKLLKIELHFWGWCKVRFYKLLLINQKFSYGGGTHENDTWKEKFNMG